LLIAEFENMFNISHDGYRPVVEVRFTPATEAHLLKHSHVSPEIQPHFIARILLEAEPRFLYLDHVAGRYVIEGYIACNPYRVVVEAAVENGVIILFPASAHRIKHKTFINRIKKRKEGRKP
jgi:hypothetical protein